MWEQSFMAAQHSPILEPEALKVLQPMYNEHVAITNLMIVLVSRGRDARRVSSRSIAFSRDACCCSVCFTTAALFAAWVSFGVALPCCMDTLRWFSRLVSGALKAAASRGCACSACWVGPAYTCQGLCLELVETALLRLVYFQRRTKTG